MNLQRSSGGTAGHLTRGLPVKSQSPPIPSVEVSLGKILNPKLPLKTVMTVILKVLHIDVLYECVCD